VVEFRNLAVAVAAVDDQGRVILVGQHRYPFDAFSWEIPEGGCPDGEDPLLAAQRELREETGVSAARWDFLGKVAISNSATDETGLLYLARELTLGEPEPECTEVLEVKRLPWDEAYAMAMEGGITDLLSVACLARARHFLERERP
jgi:8-oxo-dGTP pyrophosphatase MutT (NUDIX family)